MSSPSPGRRRVAGDLLAHDVAGARAYMERADPVERGVIRWEQLIEIGEILAGKKEGRTKADQITFYKNNAGQGVADVALGAAVLEKIKAKNTGQKLQLE